MSARRPRRSLALELTRQCPARCLYCYNFWKAGDDLGESSEPSSAELARVIDLALAGQRFSRADLTGGEPMSRPDFFDIVDRVNDHGARCAAVTDGALIGDSEARDLARRGVLRVQPTILSADADVHDEIKGQESLKDTLHAIALLKRHDVPVSVAFICTRANYDHLEEVMQLCRALGVEHLAFSRLCTTGEATKHRDELWPEPSMVAECLARLQGLGVQYHVKTFNVVAVPHCISPSGGRCALVSGRPNYTVDPWGRVRPCSVSAEALGTLGHATWEQIEARYRDELLPSVAAAVPEECARCEKLRECGGGCRESGRVSGGGSWAGLDALAVTETAR